MPPQHVEVAETILALKRKLRRDKDITPNRPTQFATNRGNKLRTGARYVHAGSLPYAYGANGWKERVEHAGYQRFILERNPRTFDEYGREVEENISDEDVEAVANEENPYGEIKLEELLRPLTHPSELIHHPTMSYAYTDPALTDMVRTTEAQLRQERVNLWNAKNLYRHFTADEPWMPCERVEATHDWELFPPNTTNASGVPNKRRKLSHENMEMPNGVDGVDHAEQEEQVRPRVSSRNKSTPASDIGRDEDMTMVDRKDHADVGAGVPDIELPLTNGSHKAEKDILTSGENPNNVEHLTEQEMRDAANEDNANQDTAAQAAEDEDLASSSSPLQSPPRRITRALAAGNNSTAPTPPLSSAPSSPTLSFSPSALQPHPLFLLPTQLALEHQTHPSTLPLSVAHSGLPPDEILETRKYLSMFIQKSEETIRTMSSILAKLIKAKRRRDKVLEWSIAEGHVGEMSDGEDWIDESYWGVVGELKKGKDEDEVAAANGTEDAERAVGIGGRKGKRRRGAAKD